MISKNWSDTFMEQLLLCFSQNFFHQQQHFLFFLQELFCIQTTENYRNIISLNCHKLPVVSEYLSLYSIKLYIGIATQILFASSRNTSLISVLHVENGAQFLNATSVFNAFCFKLNSIALLVFTFCCLTVYNIPLFCRKFRFFISWIIQQAYNCLRFHFIWYSQNFVKIKKLFLLIFQ